MKVLVTGGAGYIGAHACKMLKLYGHEVIVFDNMVYGHRDFVRWGTLEQGDLIDRNAIESVIKKYRPSAIMHFAAFTYVGESVEDPQKYYTNNVVGSLNLLDAARVHGIKHFVFSSSCAVYGKPQQIPISEEQLLQPVNPYGKTKLIVEQMLEDFDRAYDIKSVSLRYFNAAGADPDGDIGEDHEPETHLIPLVLDAAAGLRPHITIFGTDYDTGDGTCIRDYIHVADIADAHVKALDYILNGGQSTVFNLGIEKGYSVREIIDEARHITGKDISFVAGSRREGDPACLVSSSKKAKSILGWKPAYADLNTMISHAWVWHQKRLGIKRRGD